MLAEQGIVSRGRRARAPRRRSTRSRLDDVRRVTYDGTYEDLFFYVERLIVAGVRRGRRRPAAHRALPQRHRHDDVPDAAAGADPRGCCDATLDAARGRCSTSPSRHRETVFAAHTHTQPAQPTHRRALPARGRRAARARRRAARGGVREHEPQSARRLRDHRHRLSDRSRSCTSELLGFDGPTGNTYGSIATVDYLLESVSATAVLLDRARPRRAGPAALVHERVRLPAARRRVRAVQQHHAAEAQPGGARARARDRQQGARPGAARSLTAVHNTPFGDIVDTEDDLQPLVLSMFKDATRMVGLVAAAMSTAEFDRAAAGGAGGAGLDHRDGAGRHAGARRTACRSGGATRSRPGSSPKSSRRPGEPLEQVLADVSMASSATPIDYTAAELAEILSPQHFVRVRTTPGRPGAVRDQRAPARRRPRCWQPTSNGSPRPCQRLRLAEKRLDETAAAL